MTLFGVVCVTHSFKASLRLCVCFVLCGIFDQAHAAPLIIYAGVQLKSSVLGSAHWHWVIYTLVLGPTCWCWNLTYGHWVVHAGVGFETSVLCHTCWLWAPHTGVGLYRWVFGLKCQHIWLNNAEIGS
jgi:hypothetical protein